MKNIYAMTNEEVTAYAMETIRKTYNLMVELQNAGVVLKERVVPQYRGRAEVLASLADELDEQTFLTDEINYQYAKQNGFYNETLKKLSRKASRSWHKAIIERDEADELMRDAEKLSEKIDDLTEACDALARAYFL